MHKYVFMCHWEFKEARFHHFWSAGFISEMFIRIVTIKCPNERAKKALKLLNKEVTNEQMRIGLIKETSIDTSETNVVYVKYWLSEKHFDKGRKDWQKTSKEFNDMGAIISAVGGEADIVMSEDFNNYL